MVNNTTQSSTGSATLQIDDASPDSQSISEWQQVDVAQKLRVDDTCKAVDDVIREYIGDRTTFVLSDGVYEMGESLELRDFEKLAIIGEPEATIKIPDDWKYAIVAGGTSGQDPDEMPSSLVIQNITMDVTEDNVGPVCLRGRVSHHMDIDFRIKGQCDGTPRNLGIISLGITHPYGKGKATLDMSDGAHFDVDDYDGYTHTHVDLQDPIGFNSLPDHRGTLRLVDCQLEGWPNNGLYLSGNPDPVGQYRVEGGKIKNCGLQMLRLGKNDVARDVELVMDDMTDMAYKGAGVVFDDGHPVAENITIHAPDPTDDLVRFTSGGGGTLRNSRIYCGGSEKIIEANSGGDVRVESVDITDEGDGYSMNFPITVNEGRVRLKDVSLNVKHSGGGWRHGILVNTDDCDMDHVRVNVGSGDAVRIKGERINVTNSRLSGGKVNFEKGAGTVQMAGCRLDREHGVEGLAEKALKADNFIL